MIPKRRAWASFFFGLVGLIHVGAISHLNLRSERLNRPTGTTSTHSAKSAKSWNHLGGDQHATVLAKTFTRRICAVTWDKEWSPTGWKLDERPNKSISLRLLGQTKLLSPPQLPSKGRFSSVGSRHRDNLDREAAEYRFPAKLAPVRLLSLAYNSGNLPTLRA